MTFVYESDNEKDNQQRSFRPDSNGDAARNIVGQQLQDIVDAINSSTVVTKTAPTIHNINIATANIEQSLALSNNIKSLLVRSRNNADLKIAYVATESSTKFITIKKRAVYEETGLNATGLTLYFQSDTDNTDVEIIEWT